MMSCANPPQVTTLGQPLEVTKTTMAANRGDSFAGALTRIWGRGGVLGCTYPSASRPNPTDLIAPNSLPGIDPLGLDRGLY